MKAYGLKVHVFKTAKFKATGMPLVGMDDEEKKFFRDKSMKQLNIFFVTLLGADA